MSNLGTEKIEAIAESAKELVILGKKVSADGKYNLEDLTYLIGFMPKLNNVIENFKSFGEAFEEGKDLKVDEVVHLIQAIHAKVKEIEKA